MPNIKILVGSHKPYFRPFALNTGIFVPIQVGRADKTALPGMIGDNTGDNISTLNPWYSEMSALYWAWKNMDILGHPDYIGLAHYRRFFAFGIDAHLPNGAPIKPDFSDTNIQSAVASHDFIIPQPWDLLGKTVREQFAQEHYVEDLDLALDKISKKDSRRGEIAHAAMDEGSTFPCNMFVMKKEIFAPYAEFVFGVLDEVVAERNLTWYTEAQTRMPGYVAERLSHIFFRIFQEENRSATFLNAPIAFVAENGKCTVNAKQPSYPKPADKPTLLPEAIKSPGLGDMNM